MSAIRPLLSLPADHVGLYVHVPYCVRKCAYCDFPSRPLCSAPGQADRYLEALAREAARVCGELAGPVHSIYIGGGTPTTLTGAQLRRLWEVVETFPRTADAEISLEANPGTLNDDVLAALATLPLTRVSMGVQSFQPAELAMLGRIHTPREVEEGVAALRQLGVPQINLDLMYALPGQTAESWQDTLERALALRPEHLSTYSLIVEEGTPLAARVDDGTLCLPDEDAAERMARVGEALCEAAGLVPYEVSNAAQPGCYSRHNLGYWLGRDYLGLGPSATSTLGGVRWRNAEDAATYIDRLTADLSPVSYVERLSAPERLLEQVMLGLRLRDGFPLAPLEAAGGCTLAAVVGDAVATLAEDGLLEQVDGVLRLTDAGYPVANAVVTRLMLAGEPGISPALVGVYS